MTVEAAQEGAGPTRALAEFLVGLTFEELPADVIEATKVYALECIGHMLLAQQQSVSKLVVDYLRTVGAAPQAIVVGAGMRSSVAEAAYANGTFAHADELESHGTLPGTGLVPPITAALTVGDWLATTTGPELLAAVVAGVEMQGRLGTAGIGACDRGFMGISLVGPAGAAVAAGRLLHLDVDQMLNCLGIALPLGNGSLRGCGYMTHVHEAGVPTRTGVFAAQLASTGFTGCPDLLEGLHSWGDQYVGYSSRPYRPEVLASDLGRSYFLQTSDVAPKQYGSCGLTHQTMEGTVDLILEHGLNPSDIESAELVVPTWADRVASHRDPENGEQAKFSIRQGVAALLVDGVPELPYTRPFSDDTFGDPRYVQARARVKITIDDSGANQRSFARQKVILTLKGGRQVSKEVEGRLVRGHVDNPFSIEDRLDMVRRTTAGIGPDKTERLVDIVMDLEHHRVSEISELIGTVG
jgi:2-methylcitrate dehydratase PrpD